MASRGSKKGLSVIRWVWERRILALVAMAGSGQLERVKEAIERDAEKPEADQVYWQFTEEWDTVAALKACMFERGDTQGGYPYAAKCRSGQLCIAGA